MPRPVCVTCHAEMDNVLTGGVVQFNAKAAPRIKVEGDLVEKSLDAGIPPHPAIDQGPYQLWSCDVFGCRICGATVVTRYAERPLWESHNGADEYKTIVGATPPVAIVNERGGR